MEEDSEGKPSAPLYPPSWIDHMIARIGLLPGPAWLFYLLAWLALAAASHLLRWIDGSSPIGVIDPARVAEGPFVLYPLALMHYLNETARKSMEAFRPALGTGDGEVARLTYKLTTLPRGAGFIAVGVGVVLGAASFMDSPDSYGIGPESSALSVIFATCNAVFSLTFAAAFVIHSVQQLRLVTRIHSMARNINLFQRMPVYAFSALTARTGIGIVIIVYYFIYVFLVGHLFGPDYHPSLVDVGLTSILLLLAAASFVLPLNGMHNRLAEEKARLMAEVDGRFENTMQKLHRQLDADNLDRIDDLNKALASLVIERDALGDISTWPWRPETLRAFLTSVLLPILIWLSTVFLGQLLGV